MSYAAALRSGAVAPRSPSAGLVWHHPALPPADDSGDDRVTDSACLRSPQSIWHNLRGARASRTVLAAPSQTVSVASIASRPGDVGGWLGDLSKMALTGPMTPSTRIGSTTRDCKPSPLGDLCWLPERVENLTALFEVEAGIR